MIEKMKTVCIAAQGSRREELLRSLRELGILHLAEKGAADPQLVGRVSALSRLLPELKEYKSKTGKGKRGGEGELLSDEAFEELYENTLSALERKAALRERLAGLLLEADRLRPWGDFDPNALKDLTGAPQLHFYRVGKKELKALSRDENVKYIRLRAVEKAEAVAVVGEPCAALQGAEFLLPEKGLSQLEREAETCRREIADCDSLLIDSAQYLKSYCAQLLKAENAAEYSAADASLGKDGGLVWITGYIPASEAEKFTQAAKEHCWAWLMDDAEEGDPAVPTKIRYNRVTALVKPLFNILGTVPGYGEYDISFWFLAFFTLFFAMIIGDAGYGALFLVATAVLHIRTKKVSNAILLLYVLSAATVVWGSLTGTWFGLEGAMKIPFFKALVIPAFANYPEYFGLTAQAAQNSVMKFCFSIGAVQLALACIMNIRRKICRRDLGWIADVGWLLSICALYFMVLFLVVGQEINVALVASAIGLGFLLVVLFGGMERGKSFGQGLKAGAGNTFTVFLNTISAFGNVMSYIRLFAVGMASLAIAQSFNDMASGFGGALVIVGIVIMIVGHALNIVMGFLSVVVHGVRLNLLEFSGQLGMEWAGIAYEPFRELKIESNKSR